jgi:hypothetical protein
MAGTTAWRSLDCRSRLSRRRPEAMVKAFEANTSLVVTVVYNAEESDGVWPSVLHRQGLLTPSRSPEREEVPARDRDRESVRVRRPHTWTSAVWRHLSHHAPSRGLTFVASPTEPRQTLSHMRSGGGRA